MPTVTRLILEKGNVNGDFSFCYSMKTFTFGCGGIYQIAKNRLQQSLVREERFIIIYYGYDQLWPNQFPYILDERPQTIDFIVIVAIRTLMSDFC